MIEVIASVDASWGIGRNGIIPWYQPQDSRWFEQQTRSHVVVCGRQTYLSHKLPNRKYFVLSRRQSSINGLACYTNLYSAVSTAEDLFPDRKIYVIGGEQVYTEALRSGLVGNLYLTKIPEVYNCDRFFPYEELARASLNQVWIQKSHTPDNLSFERWTNSYGNFNRTIKGISFSIPGRR